MTLFTEEELLIVADMVGVPELLGVPQLQACRFNQTITVPRGIKRDVDNEIETATNTNYEEIEVRLNLLQQAIQHVPDTLSGSVDYPFYDAMDKIIEKMSNMNIMEYKANARGAYHKNVNSTSDASQNKVTLGDLLGNNAPLTGHLRVEYNRMKEYIGDLS